MAHRSKVMEIHGVPYTEVCIFECAKKTRSNNTSPINLIAMAELKEQSILRLLTQALITYRMKDGLEKLGFYSEEAPDLEIADIAFELMGYAQDKKQGDLFFDTYTAYVEKIDWGKSDDKKFIRDKATELYRQLRSLKKSDTASENFDVQTTCK